MHVYLFNTGTGACVGHVAWTTEPPTKAHLESLNPGTVADIRETPWHAEGEDPYKLVATIEAGVVAAAAIPAEPTLWAHVDLSGGDGTPQDEGGVGVANAGESARSINVAIVLSLSPATPAVPLTAISGAWRMRLADPNTGAVRYAKRVEVVEGQASLTFAAPDGMQTGDLVLREDSLIQVEGMRVRLVKPVHIVVYEP